MVRIVLATWIQKEILGPRFDDTKPSWFLHLVHPTSLPFQSRSRYQRHSMAPLRDEVKLVEYTLGTGTEVCFDTNRIAFASAGCTSNPFFTTQFKPYSITVLPGFWLRMVNSS